MSNLEDRKLYIPKKIAIGFNKRQDTYTGKLGYIIYYDDKGVLRKKASWDSWRDHSLQPVEYDNVPTEGFVLNRDIGSRGSYRWHDRIEKVRTYDPRDFEFEMSIPNLLHILTECSSIKGKGLDGKFVYAWSGTELILLPVNSSLYEKSVQFTSLQATAGVSMRELVEGRTYITRRQVQLVYLGTFNYYYAATSKHAHDGYFGPRSKYSESMNKGVMKRKVFYNLASKKIIYLNDTKSLATVVNNEVISNFADLVDLYNKSPHGSKVVDLQLKQKPSENSLWFVQETNGAFTGYETQYISYGDRIGQIDRVTKRVVAMMREGQLWTEPKYQDMYNRYHPQSYGASTNHITSTDQCLYAIMANGIEIPFIHGNVFDKE